MELPWLRWWDGQGNLLLTSEERLVEAQIQIQQERQEKEAAIIRAERLAQLLRERGINPDE